MKIKKLTGGLMRRKNGEADENAVTSFFGLYRGRYVTVAAVTHATRITVKKLKPVSVTSVVSSALSFFDQI
ncbi:hypothetical protein COLO4_04751 [Corchorus olitorius]|uniref:Uncharacterized protein n=1 Tax=Corchorus olitorius TaxID=93759 RepID=A0A1R3KSV2_9ROSI|nr:hypothetical protein COLO4_04751 [Corchorus olitorius]